MLPETRYYQIGGFKAHSHAWRQFKYDREGEEGLARAIVGDHSPFRPRTADSKGVELILGIRPSGASYLLISTEQMMTSSRALRLPPLREFWSSEDFESLSPIYFRTVDELLKKLKTYTQKSNKHRGGEASDNSQANKTYVGHAAGDSGVYRGAFEHSRVLYRILRDDIDCLKFGLPYPPWTNSIRFVSLTLNTWSSDGRTLKERLKDPKVLDIGWTETIGMGSRGKQDLGASVHIRVKENLMLGNLGSKRLDFDHGTTEIMNLASLASRLKELFAALKESNIAPIILLVHDQEVTKSVLQCAGVDLSHCKLGIRSLLGYQWQDDPPSLRQGRRSRSRSPHRHSQYDVDHKPPFPGNYSADSRPDHRSHKDQAYGGEDMGLYAPIYVIDVQSMYRRLMQTDGRGKDPLGKDVASTARELLLPGSITGWCAGNECGTLIDIWQSLAEGLPIDEQRVFRQAAAQAANAQPTAGRSDAVLPPSEDLDDNRDPNDAVRVASGTSGDPYEGLEDDDDEE